LLTASTLASVSTPGIPVTLPCWPYPHPVCLLAVGGSDYKQPGSTLIVANQALGEPGTFNMTHINCVPDIIIIADQASGEFYARLNNCNCRSSATVAWPGPLSTSSSMRAASPTRNTCLATSPTFYFTLVGNYKMPSCTSPVRLLCVLAAGATTLRTCQRIVCKCGKF
jgi:hypothetical protein